MVEVTTLDAQRLAFLDNVEADLISSESIRPVKIDSRPATSMFSKRWIRQLGMISALLAAGTPFFTLSANAAVAAEVGKASPAVPYCGVPNPVPYSHSKACSPLAYYYHEFISSSPAGPGGQRDCFHFLSTLVDSGCGADPGRYTTVCN